AAHDLVADAGAVIAAHAEHRHAQGGPQPRVAGCLRLLRAPDRRQEKDAVVPLGRVGPREDEIQVGAGPRQALQLGRSRPGTVGKLARPHLYALDLQNHDLSLPPENPPAIIAKAASPRVATRGLAERGIEPWSRCCRARPACW